MGFEILKQIKEENQLYAEEEEEEQRNPTECPDCAWPFDINTNGDKSCSICGRVWHGTS